LFEWAGPDEQLACHRRVGNGQPRRADDRAGARDALTATPRLRWARPTHPQRQGGFAPCTPKSCQTWVHVTPVELALNRTAGGKVTKAAKGAIARQLRRPWLSLLSRAEVDARETQSRVVALVRADVESISIFRPSTHRGKSRTASFLAPPWSRRNRLTDPRQYSEMPISEWT
jgi:hypothetical protein